MDVGGDYHSWFLFNPCLTLSSIFHHFSPQALYDYVRTGCQYLLGGILAEIRQKRVKFGYRHDAMLKYAGILVG